MKTLELSTYNSKEVISNGEFTCTFPPIQIDNGTTISISQLFLDSVINGAYQNISIPTNLNLHIQYGIYYMNLKGEAGKSGDGLASDLYIVRSPGTADLFVDSIQVTIPMGNYTPPELANIITKLMSSIPHVNNILDIPTIPGSLLKTSFALSNLPCKTGTSDTSDFAKVGTPITMLHTSIAPVSQAVYPFFTIGHNITITYQIYGLPPVTIQNITLLSFNQQTGELTFTPSYEFLFTDTLLSAQYYSINVQTSTPFQAIFCNQSHYQDNFGFTTPTFMGTSQFALEFDETSGKFQFTQLHMPMYSAPTSTTQAQPGVLVAERVEQMNTYFPADTRSGIFFTDLQPSSFWESLGFNLNTLLVRDNTTTHNLTTPLLRGINITSHFFGYDGLIANSYRLPVPPSSSYFYATDTVVSIEAQEQLPNNDSGYYLVELKGLTTSYATDQGNLLSSVMNIASKNYNQSGFITAYADGSIPYVNTGEPFTLTSLKVRILDPETKQVVTTLGPKNSIIVQID